MLIPLIGAGALVGLYLYEKNKHPAASEVEAAHAQDNVAPPATPADAVSLPPVTTLAGFNTLAQTISVKAPPSMQISYPAANTQVDPNKQTLNVIRYQAAQPIPGSKSYYPAAGDLWTVVVARLGGTTAARMLGQEKTSVMKTIPVADLGKLNGFVAYSDFQKWLNDLKPVALPNVANDVSGPLRGAMGQVR